MGCSPSIPHEDRLISISDIYEHSQTGDLILFSGRGNISNLVRLFSHSIWSHVAIIYRNHINNELFVLECAQDDHMIDSVTGN